MTHSTHLRLYGVGHMVNDHSESDKENTLPPYRLFFFISSKDSFICIIPDRITHKKGCKFVYVCTEHNLFFFLK